MINERILEERKTGIGGSDVAAILGLARYATRAEIWLEKIGRGREKQETERMHFGNKLESVIADEYALRNGVNLKEPTEMFRHKKYPFLIANPDRLIEGKNAVLECKNADAYTAAQWGEEGSDFIPTEYLLQAAHYRYVLDVDYVDIAVLLGGNKFRQYRYERNKELESRTIKKLAEFWTEYVVPRKEPPLQTKHDVETLLQPSDKVIEVDKELLADFEKLSICKKEISELEEKASEITDRICVFMGEASTAVDGNGTKLCTWKGVTSKRFDSTTFKKEHEDIYNNYLKEGVSRRFCLNGSYSF
jgi:putative phage-type endonuclease